MSTIPTLASPTFLSGANDALAVADVYDLVNPGVISDIESVLSEIESISATLLGSGLLGSSASTALTATSSSSGATTSGTSGTSPSTTTAVPTTPSASVASGTGVYSGNTTTVSTSDLLTRLGTASTQLNTAIRGLSTNAQTTITAGLNNNAASAQKVTLNGQTTTVNSASYSDIAQIAAVINAMSGDTAAVASDVQAFASLISGIVKICANLGIPNSFSAITTAITDTAILSTAVGLCLDTALITGDLLSIVSMAQRLGSAIVINANPNLIQTYASNFTTSSYAMLGYDTSQASAALNAILSALTTIDPNWNSTTRGTTSLIDVSSLQGASSSFTQLIVNAAKQAQDNGEISSTGEGLGQHEALAYLFTTAFGSETVIEALEATYPMVTLTTNEAVALAVDPSNMLVS